MVNLISLNLFGMATVFLWVQTSSQVANYRPTALPHRDQSNMPTGSNPTRYPTKQPTLTPTRPPTMPGPGPITIYVPTPAPTFPPTPEPTPLPTAEPTAPGPTFPPTPIPTYEPTPAPTEHPTGPGPIAQPTNQPYSTFPPLRTGHPTGPGPIRQPTGYPTFPPTLMPTYEPTPMPTGHPTGPGPIRQPTGYPSFPPTLMPTYEPTPLPTGHPTGPGPISQPTHQPTGYPTFPPTEIPTPPGPTPAPTGSYPVGVQYNKKKAKAAIAYHSCVQCYSETYAKVTTTDDVENLCTGEWLFVAATGPFFLGAFGLRSEIMLRSDGHESNQVTWFHQPGHAIGFNVTYGGIYWPLNGLAGSRVGEFDNVVSSTYRKHIYSCPV